MSRITTVVLSSAFSAQAPSTPDSSPPQDIESTTNFIIDDAGAVLDEAFAEFVEDDALDTDLAVLDDDELFFEL